MYRIVHHRSARLAFWAAVVAISGLSAHLLLFDAEQRVVVELLALVAVVVAVIAPFHGEVTDPIMVTVASEGYAVADWGHDLPYALDRLRSRSNFTAQEWEAIELVALRMHGNRAQAPAVVTLRRVKYLVVVTRR